MRGPADMLGHLSGPRRIVRETPLGRIMVPEPLRVARVVDPKEMFKCQAPSST